MSAWDYMPDDPYNFEWYRPSRYSNPWRTCRICGKEHLYWKETPNGWRLMDGKAVHSCSPVRNADEELVTTED